MTYIVFSIKYVLQYMFLQVQVDNYCDLCYKSPIIYIYKILLDLIFF